MKRIRINTLSIQSFAIGMVLTIAAAIFPLAMPAHAFAQATDAADASTAAVGAADSVAPAVSTEGYQHCTAWPFGDVEKCIVTPISNWISSWLLSLGAAFLVASGWLFDIVVRRFVVDLAGTLKYIHATEVIGTVWTVVRDISNLLIIGVFTFIAISLILGLKEYGEKRLIARVLVIAALINFSLLFTRAIIDMSNFISLQFYSASARALGEESGQFDIAQSFLTPMGITGVLDTKRVLDAISNRSRETGGTAGDPARAAAAFAFFGMFLLVAAAAVLCYGSFLIAGRAATLVFLMFTAAAAFFSHIVPKFSDSQFGWSGWWKALLNAALFGPFMMIFLWASLLIINGASTAAQNKGTLGGAIGAVLGDGKAIDSSGGDYWVVLMLYAIGIGLLFLSFKVASSMAGAGAAVVGKVTSTAGNVLAGVGGFAARQAVGRPAAWRQEGRVSEAKVHRDAAAGLRSEAMQYPKGSEEALRKEREAKQHDRAAARALRSAARYSSIADMKFGGKQSFAGGIDARTKEALKLTEKITPDSEEKGNVRRKAEEATELQRKAGLDQTKATHQAAEDTVAAIKTAADEQRKTLETQLGELKDAEGKARSDRDAGITKHLEKMEDFDKRIRMEIQTKSGEPRQEAIRNIEAARASADALRREEEKQEEARIESAHRSVLQKREELDSVAQQKLTVPIKQKDGSTVMVTTSESEAVKQEKDTATAIKKYEQDTVNAVQAAGKKAIENLDKSMEETAHEIGRSQGSIYTRVFGAMTGDNATIGKQVKKKFKKSLGKEARLRKLLREETKDAEHEEGAATKPSAPTGGTPSHA